MNRSNEHLPTKGRGIAPTMTAILLAGLALLLAACAGAQLAPVPTPIPLQATARPLPPPTRAAAAAPAPTLQPTPTPGASPAAAAPSGPSSLDDLLAQRTVEDLLARLRRGEVDTIVNLYLSDQALESGRDRVFLDLAGDGRELVETEILDLRRATAPSYEARVLLHWTGGPEGGSASQPMTLRLVHQRGLWLVDQVSLGDMRTAEAARGREPQAPASTRASRSAPPAGRLVFQVSSGGPIYRIAADGTGLRRLTDGLDPAWAPSGDRIAFARWRYPGGIYLIEPDGSGEVRVVDGDRLKEVGWSRDGQRIAFTANRGSTEASEICYFGFCFTIPAFSMSQLWVADLGSDDFLSLPLDDRAVHGPTWSPTEERIVYAGERGLGWIDLDDMQSGHFPGGSAWDSSPTFSPDGKEVAFMSRIHDHWEVLVMNADGSGRQQLTQSAPEQDPPANNVAPTWSPDGKSIAFLSNRDGPWRIYVMAADGSGERPMFGDRLDPLGLRYEWAAERVISWTK